MGVIVVGSASGNGAEVDASGNQMSADGLPATPAAGGFYTVAGSTGAVIAAALAANTMLASMRLAALSSRKAYITRMRALISVGTVGASAGVSGTLLLQRFTAQTPTGGTQRTVNRLNEPLGTISDITDIRDSNAALTGSAPTFGTVIAATMVPLFISGGAMWCEWIVEPAYPIVLQPGDGLCLRTGSIAQAATQTWQYSYTYHWHEK